MTHVELLECILDSLKNPVLFADAGHITRYMNKAAAAHYSEGYDLIGRSLFDCHNEVSGKIMVDCLAAFQAGTEEERMITDNEKYRIYMRAVRDGEGRVIGYYERYEPPVKGRDE